MASSGLHRILLLLTIGVVVVSASFLVPRRIQNGSTRHSPREGQQEQCRRLDSVMGSQQRVTPLVDTALFSWFSSKKSGGKDNGNDNNSQNDEWDDVSSGGKKDNKSGSRAGLGGVAGIMDSLENFKTSQQVGKLTSSLVQDLASMTVEGSAADGKVKVYFDGQQRPLTVKVDEDFLETVDALDLSAALTLAMKDAHAKSSERMEDKMKSFYAEMGLK